MSKNEANVTVDLDLMAVQVAEYYEVMQEGQVLEMIGDTEGAFGIAKRVVGLMAKILEDAVGLDNVVTVNRLIAAQPSTSEQEV